VLKTTTHQLFSTRFEQEKAQLSIREL